ncbi:hypothetical protein LCGC14_2977560, partial [marine sediment metagenome]
ARKRFTRTARGARPTRALKTQRPVAKPECEVVTVHFEVDNEVVSVIDNEFNRIAIFPSERIGGLVGFENPFSPERLAERLRSAIITVMSDLEPEDNGIC